MATNISPEESWLPKYLAPDYEERGNRGAITKVDAKLRLSFQVKDGYEFFASRKLVTILSATNYEGTANRGAFMSINHQLRISFKVKDGFEYFARRKLVTVYSAPGHEGLRNRGAMMKL